MFLEEEKNNFKETKNTSVFNYEKIIKFFRNNVAFCFQKQEESFNKILKVPV